MSQYVEETTGWRATLLEVIRFARVDVALPEVVVLLRQNSVVDARELAVNAKEFMRLYPRVGGSFGIEDPAVSVGDKLVALE